MKATFNGPLLSKIARRILTARATTKYIGNKKNFFMECLPFSFCGTTAFNINRKFLLYIFLSVIKTEFFSKNVFLYDWKPIPKEKCYFKRIGNNSINSLKCQCKLGFWLPVFIDKNHEFFKELYQNFIQKNRKPPYKDGSKTAKIRLLSSTTICSRHREPSLHAFLFLCRFLLTILVEQKFIKVVFQIPLSYYHFIKNCQ